jgi:hypothetical protein
VLLHEHDVHRVPAQTRTQSVTSLSRFTVSGDPRHGFLVTRTHSFNIYTRGLFRY